MTPIEKRVANLDAWFETINAPDGYGGPVIHWRQNSLQFTGAGLDWRYEGLIIGYLTLWQRTRETAWLEKAARCGMNIVAGQLANGHYRHAGFEQNPYGIGMAYEAAVDTGLLALAAVLFKLGDVRWEKFATAADRNLNNIYVKTLWDEDTQRFRYTPEDSTFYPARASGVADAFFAWAELFQNDEPIERYALPTLRSIRQLQHQNGRLHGAIPHRERAGKPIDAFYPLCMARIVPTFVKAYEHTGQETWLAAAHQAFNFIARFQTEDGLIPQAIYPHLTNRYPHWIAPLGDLLRAGKLLQSYGGPVALEGAAHRLLEGQLPSGGLRTACGFSGQVSQRHAPLPDFRDCVPVAGWSDKAFRYLVECLPDKAKIPVPEIFDWQEVCLVRGKTALWQETRREMTLTIKKEVVYRWEKGSPWAAVSNARLLSV